MGSHTCSIKWTVKARCWSNAVNACCCPCGVQRVPPVAPPPWGCSLFCRSASIEFFHLLLALKDSALRPVRLLWPLLTSRPLSRSITATVVRCAGPKPRSPQVRFVPFSRTRRIYPTAFRMTIGLSRRWPVHPRCTGLISASCTSNPRFRHRLSSDPASRRTPLPRRMVPVITVHGGLSPLESESY